MIGAAQVGQAGPNMEAMAKSKGAAYYVYLIMNKVNNYSCYIFMSLLSCLRKFTFTSPMRIVPFDFSDTLESELFQRVLKSLLRCLELSGGRYIIPTRIVFECFGLISSQIPLMLSFSKSCRRPHLVPSTI